jgi:hypothetical protein
MNPFQSLHDYELYVYTLKQRFSSIQRSTLVIVKRGKRNAILQGELIFNRGFRISLKERLSYDDGLVAIEDYGYELWHNDEKLAWYDAQPHSNDPSLALSFPHHKHIPPDIRHHRIPAPNMSFSKPNFPELIREAEELIAAENKGADWAAE